MTAKINVKSIAILIICVAAMMCMLACCSPSPELVPAF